MDKYLQKLIEHNDTYNHLPLNEMPNFYLKRPLTEHEMGVLRLIAACETDNEEQFNNWMHSIVLSGHIKNFLKAAKKAEKRGYWERTVERIRPGMVPGTIELHLVPFPPKAKEYS